MTALIIAAAIILFITLVLLIRVRIIIEYKGDDIKLILKILGIPIKLIPRKERRKDKRKKSYKSKKESSKKSSEKGKRKTTLAGNYWLYRKSCEISVKKILRLSEN